MTGIQIFFCIFVHCCLGKIFHAFSQYTNPNATLHLIDLFTLNLAYFYCGSHLPFLWTLLIFTMDLVHFYYGTYLPLPYTLLTFTMDLAYFYYGPGVNILH